MKKFFSITLVLCLTWSESVLAKDKDFYISCTAEGILEEGYREIKTVYTIIDEYKLTIGKGDITLGDRWPKKIQLINTNADQPSNFFLFRDPIDNTMSYSNRILQFGEIIRENKMEVFQSASISLVSGIYQISYKDKFFETKNDTFNFNAIGKCDGLAPVLSYLENNTSGRSNSKTTRDNSGTFKNILGKYLSK